MKLPFSIVSAIWNIIINYKFDKNMKCYFFTNDDQNYPCLFTTTNIAGLSAKRVQKRVKSQENDYIKKRMCFIEETRMITSISTNRYVKKIAILIS